jgi:hypothetical protein
LIIAIISPGARALLLSAFFYFIDRSWEKSDPVVEKDFLQALKFLSEIKGLDIISLSRLKKGAHYQLRIKSELQDRSYLFSGTPWEFETDWYTINFIYFFNIFFS